MKILRISLVLTLVVIAVFGLAYPGLITLIGQAAFSHQANGSLIQDSNGQVIGSELLAQNFTDAKYFHPRPSAAGNGYDPTNSGGSNLGPTSDKLINGIHKKTADGKDDPGNFDGVADLAKAYRTENGLTENAEVPVDAVTRSGSGLDPHISIANAEIQAPRIAKARGISLDQVKELIQSHTEGKLFGLDGEQRVNVLLLNRALDAQGH